jgi:hypothetical protein
MHLSDADLALLDEVLCDHLYVLDERHKNLVAMQNCFSEELSATALATRAISTDHQQRVRAFFERVRAAQVSPID